MYLWSNQCHTKFTEPGRKIAKEEFEERQNQEIRENAGLEILH